MKIRLISTDFDGTLFAEFEDPPVPARLQQLIAELQAAGAKWVINTGRDMSSLMETLGRAGLSIQPDYLVLVEREIHLHQQSRYVSHQEWNCACERDNTELFTRIQQDMPRILEWINSRFQATLYEDNYSPFCMIASNTRDADQILDFLNDYCRSVPNLTVVRNDVYARFCHAGYSKGTALAEVSRLLNLSAEHVFAIGDHLNDLPMLNRKYARFIAAPSNAVPPVREVLVAEGGYLASRPHGDGVVEALEHYLSEN
jgi:HAD superfamily hydrolase (TIGR01484 family)